MTIRTATLTTFALFTIACADESAMSVDAIDMRAELADVDGIQNSTEGDGSADEAAIVPDDTPRLVQGLMQDIYDSGEDCIPGATVIGTFSEGVVTAKALDTLWTTAATISADLVDGDAIEGEWTGISDAEIDPNDPVVPEVESGDFEGLVDAESETWEGIIDMGDAGAMFISGYWVPQSDISGFFFGVSWDCE